MAVSRTEGCWRTECRSFRTREIGGQKYNYCYAVQDVGDFWQHCPFYKTEAVYQAERRQLEKHGHRIEYIPPSKPEEAARDD